MKRFGHNWWCVSALILLLFSSGLLHLCVHWTNHGVRLASVDWHHAARLSPADPLPGLALESDCQFCAGVFQDAIAPVAIPPPSTPPALPRERSVDLPAFAAIPAPHQARAPPTA